MRMSLLWISEDTQLTIPDTDSLPFAFAFSLLLPRNLTNFSDMQWCEESDNFDYEG